MFEKAALAWTLPWDADWVSAVAFLGSSRRIAAGNNLGQILVWDLPEKPGGAAPLPVRQLTGHTNIISRLQTTKDGRWLISSSYDHSIRIWDMQAEAKGAPVETVLNARTIEDLKRRSASKLPAPIAAKLPTQSAAEVLTGHKEWITGMTLSRDEKMLLSGDDAGQVVVWDFPGRKELRRWKVKGWAYALALSPDNKQACVSERYPVVFDSGRHTGIKLWDVETGKEQRNLEADFKGQQLSRAAYSPDGTLLAIGRGGEVDGLNGKVTLIDPGTGKKVRECAPGHEHGITDIVFHPDGKHLASSGRDTLIRIWNTADGKLVKEVGKSRGGQFKDWMGAVAFSGDGKWLIGGDMAGAVVVWQLTE